MNISISKKEKEYLNKILKHNYHKILFGFSKDIDNLKKIKSLIKKLEKD